MVLQAEVAAAAQAVNPAVQAAMVSLLSNGEVRRYEKLCNAFEEPSNRSLV